MRSLIIAIVVLVPFITSNLSAQGISGNEFHFSIPQNFRSPSATDHSMDRYPPEISCCISSRSPVDVSIRINGQSFDTLVHAEPGKPAIFTLPATVTISSTDSVENKSVTVQSPRPISVTIGFHKFQTTESFSVLPTNYYGREYRIASYTDLAPDLRGVATITALENQTQVTVKAAPGDPFQFEKHFALNANQSVRVSTIQFRSDLTGAMITSNKKVSVISGHTCAYVPEKVDACNYLAEHLPHLGLLGRTTVVPKLPGKAKDVVRIIGTKNGTAVDYKGQSYSVDAGKFVEVILTDSAPAAIRATEPVLVVLYSTGFKSGDSVGDPSMMILPPTDLWERVAISTNPFTSGWEAKTIVVIPTEGISTLRVNGKLPVDAKTEQNVNGYTQMTLPLVGNEAVISSGYKIMVLTVCYMPPSNLNAYDGWGHVNTWAVPDP